MSSLAARVLLSVVLLANFNLPAKGGLMNHHHGPRLQRIKLYPEKGFQIYQEVTPDVWSAYEELVEPGYERLVD